MSEEINPTESTLASATGKISVGVGLVTLIAGVTIPFLPEVQKNLLEKNYIALLSTVILLVSANIAAIKLHQDSTAKKVAMIQANTLPMSTIPKTY